jgi:hypothetical protein
MSTSGLDVRNPSAQRVVVNDDALTVDLADGRFLDDHSVDTYTMAVSSILYFQRKMTGSALICSK